MTMASSPTRALNEGTDGDQFLTLSEAAEILRVPVNTLRWWRQLGTGPNFFKIGRRLVVTAGDLREWIAAQKAVDGASRPGQF